MTSRTAWIAGGVVAAVIGLMLILTAAGAVGLAVYFYSRTPAPVIIVPSPTTIEALLSGHPEDARRIAAVHAEMANVIEADAVPSAIKTTADLRQANSLVGRLMFGDELKGRYAGLGQLIDAEIAEAVGVEVRPLDNELRLAAVQAYRSLATRESAVR